MLFRSKYDIARLHADITASKHENEGLRGEKAYLRGGIRDRILELLGESIYLGQIELLHEESLAFQVRIEEIGSREQKVLGPD